MAWPSDRSKDGGIDEIPLPRARAGRLFLCGKHAVGPDPDALLARVGATTIVCLTERHEIANRHPQLVAILAMSSTVLARPTYMFAHVSGVPSKSSSTGSSPCLR